MGHALSFQRPDGRECPGYYAQPAAGDDAPGVVLIQEWWGVDDFIKSAADRLAANGYRALVPDLYRGKVTLVDAEAAHLMGNLDFADAASQDVRGAASHLKLRSRKVAVLGMCMGGALSILAAIHVPELDAVSCWYGVPPPEAGDPATIRIPLQGHFAQRDPYFPPAMVDALEAKLKQGGVPHEFHRYQAEHAFGNDRSSHYDHVSAELAWQRSLDFLAKHCR
jgi:carboxymethylenebutenolidase